MRSKQTGDLDILLRDASLLRVASPGTPFCLYGFAYSCGALAETFHRVIGRNDLTAPLAGGKSVGCQVLKNGVKAMFLEGRHRLRALLQLHVEGHVGCLHQHILIGLLVREDR